MNTVRFTSPSDSEAYYCSKPGDQSGEYVPAEVTKELLEACKAVVETDGYVGSAIMRKRIDAMKAAIAKFE